jgi:trigger factor
VESATVKDASGNVLDLKNLRPDGTLGEPVDETAEVSDVAEVDEVAEAPAEEGSAEEPTEA